MSAAIPTGQAYVPYTTTPLQYAGAPPAATRQAIVRYLRYMRDPLFEPEPDMLEMRLVVEYYCDRINAPWVTFPPEIVAHLREQIEHVKLPEELASWLEATKALGGGGL